MAALLAAGSSALLLMAADQGAAALAEAVRVRGRIGGGLPWYQEFERYALLLTPGDVQGAIGRRAAVLATLLAVVGVAWVLAGRRPLRDRRGPGPPAAGDARAVGRRADGQPDEVDPALRRPDRASARRRSRWGSSSSAAAPSRPLRDADTARQRQVAGLAAVTVVCGLVLAGQNMWPFVSGWYTPTFSTVPPLVGTVPIATIVLVLGGVVVVPLLAWSVWRRSAQIPGGPTRPRAYRNAETAYQNAELLRFCTRRVPAPAAPVAVVLVAVLALQVLEPRPDRGGPRATATPPPRTRWPRCGATRAGCSRRCRSRPTPPPGSSRSRRRRPPSRDVPAPAVPRPHPSTSTRAGRRCPASRWPAPADVLVHPRSPAARRRAAGGRHRDRPAPAGRRARAPEFAPGSPPATGARDGPADRSGARHRRCAHGPAAARPGRGRLPSG